MTNQCGGCTACCTIMRVEMEPIKPARCACPHATSRGCGIYDTRPEPCRDWACLWLITQTEPDMPSLDRDLRPDRCGVVMEVNSAGNIVAHCARPLSWKREPIRTWLLTLAKRTPVLLEFGDDVAPPVLLHPDGTTEPLTVCGVDPVTNNRLYKRAT